MGPVGVQEMVVIFLVALVLFGPKKLPELGKTIGKAITEFRRAQSELKTTFESHMRELEKENESIKQVTQAYTGELYNYDTPYYESGQYGAESYESTEAHPSTVSASAPQGAEPTVSHETGGNGTVPRTTTTQPSSEHAASGETAPESHSVNS
jgi:sec-independent protein translocase protein TatA